MKNLKQQSHLFISFQQDREVYPEEIFKSPGISNLNNLVIIQTSALNIKNGVHNKSQINIYHKHN